MFERRAVDGHRIDVDSHSPSAAGTATACMTVWPASVSKRIVAVAATEPKVDSEKTVSKNQLADALGEEARDVGARQAASRAWTISGVAHRPS